MITYEEANQILSEYIDDQKRINHSRKSAIVAEDVAININKKGFANVDVDFVKICALLHDIGKSKLLKKDEHAYNGGKLLRRIGLKEIAVVIERHSNAQEENDFIGRKIDLIQNTIEQKIITYADMHTGPNGESFTFDERAKDIGNRYIDREEILIPFRNSIKRLKAIMDEVEELMQ